MTLINEDNTCVSCGCAPIEVKGWDTCQKCFDKLNELPDLDDDPFGFNEDRARFEALLGDIEIDL